MAASIKTTIPETSLNYKLNMRGLCISHGLAGVQWADGIGACTAACGPDSSYELEYLLGILVRPPKSNKAQG
jgi:hypothetical protein